MKETLFHGYDQHLQITPHEGATVDASIGRNDTPIIELKVYERHKRAVSAFLPPASAKALAQEILRTIEHLERL